MGLTLFLYEGGILSKWTFPSQFLFYAGPRTMEYFFGCRAKPYKILSGAPAEARNVSRYKSDAGQMNNDR